MGKVSICVPSFNGERFIGSALNGLRAQTYDDFELVVCDDCSTDDTRQVIAAIRDPRLRLHVSDRRLGLVGNWNRCVELASGEYIQIFHQDDVLRYDAVARLADALDRHPKAGFAFSNAVAIDASDSVIGGHWYPHLPKVDAVFSGQEFFRLLLTEGNVVPCSSVMMRSSHLHESGFFDERLSYTPDMEMWLRLSIGREVAYVAEPLLCLRRHQGQESTRFVGRAAEVDEVWQAVRIVFDRQRTEIPDAEGLYTAALNHLSEWSRMLCMASLKRGRFGAAWGYALRWTRFRRAKRPRSENLAHLPAGGMYP